MFKLHFKSHFDAAHFLREYEGKCSNIHGHRWTVEGCVSGTELDSNGILVDFIVLKQWLKDICNIFDHNLINQIDGFREGEWNPTAENIAKYTFLKIEERLRGAGSLVNLELITVWESNDCGATYEGNKN